MKNVFFSRNKNYINDGINEPLLGDLKSVIFNVCETVNFCYEYVFYITNVLSCLNYKVKK